jgi:cupin fold WbuC family metalloprotein
MRCSEPGVYVADQPIVAIGRGEIDFLRSRVQTTGHPHRLYVHRDRAETLHETFVGYGEGTYIHPKKETRESSFHLLQGGADLVLFDEQGNITNVRRLGELSSGMSSYCRVPENAYHTLRVRSQHLIIHEGLAGPEDYDDGRTILARWAPPQTDAAGARAFGGRLDAEIAHRTVDSSRAALRVVQESPEVFTSDEAVGRFGQAEMELLRGAIPHAPRRRVRICMHKSVDDRHHEMFIMFYRDSYVAAGKHLGKDESVVVLEGKADLVLFDEAGAITDVISLGDGTAALPFYFRTPRERYHTWVLRSDIFAVHETTEGPFRRTDTIFAPWSPGEVDDPTVVQNFQTRLEAQATAFLAGPSG